MKLKCRCDYEWDYKGSMKWATCPSCLLKMPVHGKEKKKEAKFIDIDEFEKGLK